MTSFTWGYRQRADCAHEGRRDTYEWLGTSAVCGPNGGRSAGFRSVSSGSPCRLLIPATSERWTTCVPSVVTSVCRTEAVYETHWGAFGGCDRTHTRQFAICIRSISREPSPFVPVVGLQTPRRFMMVNETEAVTISSSHSPPPFTNSIPRPFPRLREYCLSFGLFQCS